MRLRIEQKIRKRLRLARGYEAELVPKLRPYVRRGIRLEIALESIMLDTTEGHLLRGTAAQVLAINDNHTPVALLLKQFFEQTEKVELWKTALSLEHLGDRCAIQPLIEALHDPNPHRRHAAARALGWIPKAGNRAADALIAALTDPSQPQPVREEAAESLAYLHSQRSIAALISVLSDPDERIRFWAVFALGTICDRRTGRHTDRRVVPALESMLNDHAIPPGNWWSVGREALAMLGHLDPPEADYRERLANATQLVLEDPNSSPEDRHWAEGYQ